MFKNITNLQIIKIVVATGLSIGLAQLLSLENVTSAGIIAMLSVLETRKSSLTVGWQRLVSTVLALALATISFSVLGFELPAFLLYLIVFVFIAYRFDMRAAIAPCSVLVTHLWLSQNLSFAFLWNEFLLMLIGAGIAIFLHIYMPSQQSQIEDARVMIEGHLRTILSSMAQAVYVLDEKLQSRELVALEKDIKAAKALVYQEQENQLFRQIDYDLHYLDMRQDQVRLLMTMDNNLAACRLELTEAKLLASLFELTAAQLSEHNPATCLLEDIKTMLAHFRERDLPKTREEFETRAILFQLLTDLTRFIQLKIDFYKEYSMTNE
ncbi:aromatic acid exporter family protein [Streptococcus merionis]|uniref:aromatic acid exporter family protein n=1 Tax=Streptococcus merionis TaxID=400065 RepID=UPI0035115A53